MDTRYLFGIMALAIVKVSRFSVHARCTIHVFLILGYGALTMRIPVEQEKLCFQAQKERQRGIASSFCLRKEICKEKKYRGGRFIRFIKYLFLVTCMMLRSRVINDARHGIPLRLTLLKEAALFTRS